MVVNKSHTALSHRRPFAPCSLPIHGLFLNPGAVGTEKRPPLIVVVGLGKGTEGPREQLGALWPLVSLLTVKVCIMATVANLFVLCTGPKIDGAFYCAEEDGCASWNLRYAFTTARLMAIFLALLGLCLELGIPSVVEGAMGAFPALSWCNQYPARALYYFLIGALTLPDKDWAWDAGLVSDGAYFAMDFAGALLVVAPATWLLKFVPRGYPTSVKTQRPESTFWATVTLITCVLCLCGEVALMFELFVYHDSQNLAEASYKDSVNDGHNNFEGKRLFVYQQYMLRLVAAILLPLLFAAELEVTPVLARLPEVRYLVTKGPMYLLVGTILLVANRDWPSVDFLNYTGYAMLITGTLYLGFPAVRVVHELFGDRLSPKTRFYPGLYTFFSVWGVMLGIQTVVLFGWEVAVYDTGYMEPYDKMQWYVFKVYGVLLALLAIGVEFELSWLYEMAVGGVPVHFDFLRNWGARAFLYILMACLCAEGVNYDGYVSLFDLDRAVMWLWLVFGCVYLVFHAHLVSSAVFYRWYVANGAWFSKRDGDEGGEGLSESTTLLGSYLDEESAAGLQARQAGGRGGGLEHLAPKKKAEGMKRFVLQPRGRLVITPLKFVEDERDAARRAGLAGGKVDDGLRFFVKCVLGEDATGSSKPVAAAKLPKPKGGTAPAAPPSRSCGWSAREGIPLEVSAAVARAGKEAAIEVQVWSQSGGKKGAWSGSSGGELQVGEARVALDQLTLGVPGTVQLHAAHSPGVRKGTLELVISYEPAPDAEDGTGRRVGKSRAAQDADDAGAVATARAAAGAAAGGAAGAADRGVYESAVDPNSGRKYWYNRTTGHRTWNKPVAEPVHAVRSDEQALTNAAI